MPRPAGVRVVAGRFRGFRVQTLGGVALRPTADRVKEALFSILGARVRGARVVDCFAGTGSLGIEALSRGAARVHFVERDPGVLAVLRSNLERLPDGGGWTVIRGDGLEPRGWAPACLPVDLVLADPPYRRGAGDVLLAALARGIDAAGAAPLEPGGLLVLEHEKQAEPGHPAWELADRRRYGDTVLGFYRWIRNDEGGPDANRDLSGNV